MEVNGQLHALAFFPRNRAPGTSWIGDWVGPTAVLEAAAKRKNSLLLPRIEPRSFRL